MFLTAGHLSTPFWYFAVLASSSHPPAHNLLCTHQIGMASVRHRGRRGYILINTLKKLLGLIEMMKSNYKL